MVRIPEGHPEKPEGDAGRALLQRMNGGSHEQLALWALSQLDPATPVRNALDVGCGGGANIARLLSRFPGAHVDGIDYSPVAVALASEVNADAIAEGTVRIVEGDVATLPYPDEPFDLVTAFETVYFWPDMPRALAEIHRVLAPGGFFLIANDDDGSSEDAADIAAQIPGMSIYAVDDLASMLRLASFRVESVGSDKASGRIAVVASKPIVTHQPS